MKRGTIVGFWAGVVMAGFSLAAHADVEDNRYQVIVDRNPFGLRPIPIPVVTPVETNAPPPPPLEIKLTGITTLLGPPRVFLEITETGTKKTDRPQPLGENDSDVSGQITVLTIDTDNQKVLVKNGDAQSWLDFDKNGIKPSATVAAAPVPHPGVPVNPAGVPHPVPGGVSAAPPANSFQGRGAIVSGGSSGVNPGGVPGAVNPLGSNLPPRPLRTDSSSILAGGGGQVYNPNPQPAVPAQRTYTREEAEARIEATRRILEQQGNPQSRILPPTSLGRALNTPPAPGAQ